MLDLGFRAKNLSSLLMFFMLSAGALTLPARAAEPRVPPPPQLAPGVYAVVGKNVEPTPANYGGIGNQGIVIGDDGVILIDTGTSARYATELIETVRRLTSKPIVLAINTHQHPAFVFGNGTLASQGVPILAHRDVAELIKQRCEKCLKKLNAILGADEMKGEGPVAPIARVDGLGHYLAALQSAVERTYQQGVSLHEAGAYSELPPFKQWPLYRPAHNKPPTCEHPAAPPRSHTFATFPGRAHAHEPSIQAERDLIALPEKVLER